MLGLALRASLRMHVASLVGMLLFLFIVTDSAMAGHSWGAFWAFAAAVAFNTLFVFVEGLMWASRMERQARQVLTMMAEEEKTPIMIVPVKHTWMN